jgi:ribA/ribD-fused uncharacterized protein
MINRFNNEYRWLSNFALVPIYFEHCRYPSVENAYVAAKTLDNRLRGIVQKVTPGEAKLLGKLFTLRPDWNTVRLELMATFLRQKFSYAEFRDKLVETGTQEIVEGNNWHDNYWGSCGCAGCGNKGQNNLGKLLVQIREELLQLPLDFSKK